MTDRVSMAKPGPPPAVGCEHPYPVDITSFSDPDSVGLCTGCGQRMSRDDRGRWVIAAAACITEGDQTPGEGSP